MTALQFVSRFALPPNSKGYCGRGSAPAKLLDCISNGKCEGVAEELDKFIVLHPYLKTIAQITGKHKFDYAVVEAYWIGNNLLQQIKNEHYDLLLENFAKQGVPDFFIKKLQENPPRRFVPTHLFQVVHIGVGKASGVVPFNITSINECMIRWGDVLELSGDKATIRINMLTENVDNYKLTQRDIVIDTKNSLEQTLQVGDIIAYHWGRVVKKLTDYEVKQLKYWTVKTLEAFKTLEAL